jgi:protein-S-isoprenylcysteine O-methyltransferase Ste14
MKLNLFTLMLLAVAVIAAELSLREETWNTLSLAGVCLAAPALVLLVIARLQLGRAFSIHAKATTLVTNGLYSRIRNPIYVFGTLILIGAALVAHRPQALWILVALVPLQLWRSRNEERVLAQAFGDEYLRYKRKTWF